jgi:hypothetical protein
MSSTLKLKVPESGEGLAYMPRGYKASIPEHRSGSTLSPNPSMEMQGSYCTLEPLLSSPPALQKANACMVSCRPSKQFRSNKACSMDVSGSSVICIYGINLHLGDPQLLPISN